MPRPILRLPGILACVALTGLHALAQVAVQPAPVRPATPIHEDFTSPATADLLATGAFWGGGRLIPGSLGGSGELGDFVANDGRSLGRIGGYDVYEWSTDNQLIPAARTLRNRATLVTDGVFRFQSFHVQANERVIFRGSRLAQVFVTGSVVVEGIVDVSAPDQPALFDGNQSNGLGQPGGAGGPGAGRGGSGANHPVIAPGKVNGEHGEDVRVLPGSPYLSNVPGTGGRGSLANPAGANPANITWSLFGFFSLQLAAGGGAGSLYATQGNKGAVTSFSTSFPNDPGPDAPAGAVLFAPPVTPSAPSAIQFLIGGAGGGGGGTSPYNSVGGPSRRDKWHAGAGGSGGGGAILLRAGLGVLTMPGASLFAKGGNCFETLLRGEATPGGGGSGGSILIQAPNHLLLGGLDLRGGSGGFFHDRTAMPPPNPPPNGYRTDGGAGGPGYVRLESVPRPSAAALGTVFPPATLDNTGLLAETDDVTGARSLWYFSGSSRYRHYEVEADVGANRVVFSDDPRIGPPAVLGYAPVALFVQGAVVDPRTLRPAPGTIGPWHLRTGDLASENGTGMRWFVLFDRAFLGSGVNLVVRRVTVWL